MGKLAKLEEQIRLRNWPLQDFANCTVVNYFKLE